MLRPADGEAGHAVVAVSQDLDPHALIVLQRNEQEEKKDETAGSRDMHAVSTIFFLLAIFLKSPSFMNRHKQAIESCC